MLDRVESSICSLGSPGDGFDLRGCLGYCIGSDSARKLSSTSLNKTRTQNIPNGYSIYMCPRLSETTELVLPPQTKFVNCNTYALWQRSVTLMKLVSEIRKQAHPRQDAWVLPWSATPTPPPRPPPHDNDDILWSRCSLRVSLSAFKLQ